MKKYEEEKKKIPEDNENARFLEITDPSSRST